MSGVARDDSGHSPKWEREFALSEVRRLDVEAVRIGDGFDYRYYPGGRITWFSPRSGDELEVTQLSGLPTAGWWHLEGCACRACSPMTALLADEQSGIQGSAPPALAATTSGKRRVRRHVA
jgi:hypothetical protein